MAANDPGAALALRLVKEIVRAFYDTKEIVIIQCITIHSALRDDDLQFLTQIPMKELHKLCAGLTEDRLIAT
jgi:transcription initiation factor TFIIE subunit alpha